MNSQRIQRILASVNTQLNSNTLIPHHNWLQVQLNKRQLMKELKLLFPKEMIKDQYTFLYQFGQLYSNFRRAHQLHDRPKMIRYLSHQPYQQWKQGHIFNVYPLIYNIQILNCGFVENAEGKWAQSTIELTHKDQGKTIHKKHIVQRKLVSTVANPRKWYFCQFQN